MAIYKQNWFKYAKNLVIGVGASVVMIGALFKILSLEGGDQMLTAGLVTEVENQLGGMLGELQMMSKSLGSLKALQEVDFSKTGDQIKGMGNFYTRMNEAMAELGNSLEDTKNYKNQVAALNKNLTNLNSVYGNILGAYKTMGSSQS